MKIRSITAAALAICVFCHIAVTSCDDETSTIGTSIAEDDITVKIDSSFTISGHTVSNGAVQSRTLLQLLGRIDAEGYGSLSSDVVTQFMPSSALDTTGVSINTIDSLKLVMVIAHGNFIGDSIAPMGIDVYRLNRDLPSPIYSDFDPTGYYDPDKKIGSKIYNASTLGEHDSLRNANYHYLYVPLPRELAQEFFIAYKSNPDNFSSPSSFIGNIFKGLYIKNSYGKGRVTLVSQTILRVYYHRYFKTEQGLDSLQYKIGNYFAVTPEIVTNNNIDLTVSPEIRQSIANGENIIVAPAGYDVEFTFPGREIIASYKNGKGDLSVINSLSLTLPVDSIDNDFGLAPPPYMLMVLKSKKDEFFQNSKLPDNTTSFYAAYDSTNKQYVYSDMRDYVIDLLDKENISDDDVTFILTPVTVTTESNSSYYYGTTSTVTAVTPYVSLPSMVKILFDQAKIHLTYSNQTINY